MEKDAEKLLGAFLELIHNTDILTGCAGAQPLSVAMNRIDGLSSWWENWKTREERERALQRGYAFDKLTRAEAAAVGVLDDWQAHRALKQLSDVTNTAIKQAVRK